ncbi:MAG: 2-oxoglutarate dehydrogenase E1 component [Bacteroidia bacterium]|nr:2-oxoglutarate dehydrogenase E1 component [Bacteroidia bacterium]MCX7652072.1 2-oxoglutarate dehydrogenase E1 component [Bacteroidia bacterium]MDW8416942.1 2-oxoglutarate dehydrogenase E1 component [Bacteroidia bacterium]
MTEASYLFRADPSYIEGLLRQYEKNPQELPPDWQRFFEGYFAALSNGAAVPQPISAPDTKLIEKEFGVMLLVAAYRNRGHLFARLNPLADYANQDEVLDREFPLQSFGLSADDLDTVFQAGKQVGLGPATLREIIAHLRRVYCSTIGIEYRYIRIPEIFAWFEERLEKPENLPRFSPEEKKTILQWLCNATTFERFLHRKFVGQKRFSLEGNEAIIPALYELVEKGAQLGIEEFVFGMAHRGRLNVLTNIMQKSFQAVFGEFEGKGIATDTFDGDVKYHLGYSSDPVVAGKRVHLSMLPNPSHLEAVDPVATGATRAKMDHLYGGTHDKIVLVLIHGDAAIAGQGVVYETLQMSLLPGYEVGGTIHIVLNNQIGFTTGEAQARSSHYATDIAKVTLSPVFHVNGNDPEAVVHAMRLAIAFRQAFNRDVFIDVIGYRRHGHNEGDEPRFTQPHMYAAIAQCPSPFEVYAQRLIQEGVLSDAEYKRIERERMEFYEGQLERARHEDPAIDTIPRRTWQGIQLYDDHVMEAEPQTSVRKEVLEFIAQQAVRIPEGFTPHPTVRKVYESRYEAVKRGTGLDWGTVEMLAYGSLLLENNPVRLSGQDVERGTFSHRHAVLIDQRTEARHIPLNHLSHRQAPFYIYNSPLSEYAVLGFEYGYALASPHTLVIWEAQFGDFMNGAQIIIDQYIAAAKTKWQRLNGLTLYLPHGYEGQGPEHSSARPERFLILAAQNNMYICNFTHPANLFHALRRQVRSITRRPLVIFTPKSLLRHPECVASMSDLTEGGFRPILPDPEVAPDQARRLLLCTGKIFYDLVQVRREHKKYDTAIIRIEQLYPFPEEELRQTLSDHLHIEELYWVQEEPSNMGYWTFILRKFMEYGLPIPKLIARRESASPATGSYSHHVRQQNYILRKALDIVAERV